MSWAETPTDEDLLEQENISEMDMFLLLTNDDEDNIMSATLAKRLGCKRVVALINRRAYADMVQGADRHRPFTGAGVHRCPARPCPPWRRGRCPQSAARCRRGLEMVAHGDAKTSKVVGPEDRGNRMAGRRDGGAIVRDLDEQQVIGVSDDGTSIRRFGRVVIAHRDTVIESGDHVIIFCVRKKLVRRVEKLFQVGFGFL